MLVLLVTCLAAEDNGNCKCFEEFESEKEGDNWICRGKKNYRIFECGEIKPPQCICNENGKEVILDIGETNCFKAGSTFDDIHCSPKAHWDTYYQQNPGRRIYHWYYN